MKTLNDHTLIYDKDCPMCVGYTTAFMKIGILDENGREPFTEMSENTKAILDIKKASNEIALIDRKSGKVIYGIDSMLKVIGHRFPLVNIIGNWAPVNFCLKKLYKFISYNRKVIVPSKKDSIVETPCVPSFNYTYRLLYILLATLVTGLVLSNYSDILIEFVSAGSIWREFLIAGGQIIAQSLVLFSLESKKTINYLGNMMTISLVGSLLLLPFLWLDSFIQLPSIFGLLWFGSVVIWMLLEHIRRVKLLQLPFILSISWVIYRGLILLILL